MTRDSRTASAAAFDRRDLLKLGGSLALTGLPAVSVFAATPLRIGFVSPQTGPLAAFAEPDMFVMEQVKKAVAGGIKVGGVMLPVEIIYKDSQSNSNRAADAASELIVKDKCDIIVAASTPATTNPVADQCELNGVPCITADTPWQPHFFGRGGDPKKGFEWTNHFFWGLEDIIGSFTSLWSKAPTNKAVGVLWPNDSDGNAWADAKLGFPPVLAAKGFKLSDKGRLQLPADNFSAFIAEYKKADAQILTGVLPPPDFANFWAQAGQQGYKPKIVTCAKATEFPAAVASMGDRGAGLTVELWWSPAHPFASSLTKQSSAEFAAAYTASTQRPWTMPMAFKHALFEVAIDALQRAGSRDPKAIRDAIRATHLNTMVGPLDFRTGPVPSVSKTPLVSAQWKRRGKGLELLVVENSQAPMVKVQDELELLK
jgi:branched-chain amino acid transport system substrate-binding protein